MNQHFGHINLKRKHDLNYVYVSLCILYFDLAWNSSIYKFSLIKAKWTSSKHYK